jgi:phospholipid-binding lipoprotein MlaA
MLRVDRMAQVLRPPQRKGWLLCLLAMLLAGTSIAAPVPATTATTTAPPVTQANPDPWEGFNRRVFAFDMQLDRYLLKPVAKGYRKATPDWGQTMVNNFFGNLKDVKSSINALFQARFGQAGSDLSRVLINTSMGVGGLFDVATYAGIERYEQDFGLTLARWGVGAGPYLVLPLFGPSTVRDGIAMVPGTYTWPPHYLQDKWIAYGLDTLYGISKRASLLDMENSIIGDKYIFVRNYYLQSRAVAEGKAPVQDNFGSGADSSDDDGGW